MLLNFQRNQAPFFSKQKVLALQPLLQQLVDKLCKKFEKCKGTDEVVPMECAFDAFTMDVITEYSLDTSLYVSFELSDCPRAVCGGAKWDSSSHLPQEQSHRSRTGLLTPFINSGYLDVPGWSSDFRELERAFGEMGYRQKMFPPLISIMYSLPDKLVLWMVSRAALNCLSIPI